MPKRPSRTHPSSYGRFQTFCPTEWPAVFGRCAQQRVKGPLTRANQEEQSAYLLIWVGNAGRDIYNSWGLSEEESQDIDTLLRRFRDHTAPKKNTVFAKYVFQERKQADESFDAFVTDLRNLVHNCQYDNPKEMVRDKIVCGVKSQEVREKLLTEGDDLMMDRAIEKAVTYETMQQRLRSMATGLSTTDNTDAITQS